ncbi:uncharacterized protein LOC128228292 [Mya arenaria]|uniref:uncharacterized protein LOC128228292 n=1 Tax=Mya arenaria TaxID=6604 RepID=UPI0022E2168F|nr:uncharacterized protein LOC128228292 [Mya arenaria]
MEEDSRSWEERCDRYFSSISDTEKDRGQEKHLPPPTTPEYTPAAGNGHSQQIPGTDRVEDNVQPWSNLSDLKLPLAKNKVLRRVQSGALARVDVHGTRMLATSTSLLEAAVWSVFMLGSLAVTAYLGYLIVSNFQTSGTVFKLQEHALKRKEFRFSVCNLNLVKKSSIENSPSSSFLEELIGRTNESSRTEQLKRDVKQVLESNGHFSEWIEDDAFIEYLEADVVVQEMQKLSGGSLVRRLAAYQNPGLLRRLGAVATADVQRHGHTASGALLDCWMGNRRCQQTDYSNHVDGTTGGCLTFSILPRTREIVVTMDIQISEYIPDLTTGVGIAVYIHPKDTPPNTGTRIIATHGAQHIIDIQKVKSIIRKQHDCDSGSKTIQESERACLDERVNVACGCQLRGDTDGACDLLSYDTYICYQAVVQALNIKQDCPLACQETLFQADMKSDGLFTEADLRSLQDLLGHGRGHSNVSASTVQDNVVRVTLDVSHVVEEVWREDVEMSVLALLSGLGGLSALVAGVSLITVLQVAWLLASSAVRACRKSCCRRSSEPQLQRLSDSEITSITWAMFRQRRRLEETRNITYNERLKNAQADDVQVSAISGNVNSRLSKRLSYLSSGSRKEISDKNKTVTEGESYSSRIHGGHAYQRRYSSNYGRPDPHSSGSREMDNKTNILYKDANNVHTITSESEVYRPNRIMESTNGQLDHSASCGVFRDTRLAPVHEAVSYRDGTFTKEAMQAVNRDAVQFYKGSMAHYTSNNISEPVYL